MVESSSNKEVVAYTPAQLRNFSVVAAVVFNTAAVMWNQANQLIGGYVFGWISTVLFMVSIYITWAIRKHNTSFTTCVIMLSLLPITVIGVICRFGFLPFLLEYTKEDSLIVLPVNSFAAIFLLKIQIQVIRDKIQVIKERSLH